MSEYQIVHEWIDGEFACRISETRTGYTLSIREQDMFLNYYWKTKDVFSKETRADSRINVELLLIRELEKLKKNQSTHIPESEKGTNI